MPRLRSEYDADRQGRANPDNGAGEGGIIATNDDILAERCRIGRDYGNPGDYDTRFVGLNARMSEMHAATALASFDDLEERIERRNQLDLQINLLAEHFCSGVPLSSQSNSGNIFRTSAPSPFGERPLVRT